MSVSETLRQQVIERARNCCEYCRISQDSRLISFHIDHIIAQKHDGTDTDDNLCLACYKYNGYKGSNVTALDPETGEASRLFHPRQQKWNVHFQLEANGFITGLTPEGRTTVAVLRINEPSRIEHRYLLMQLEEYPCENENT